MDKEHKDNMIEIVASSCAERISYFDAIEAKQGNIRAGIYHRICFDDGGIDIVIEEALKTRPNEFKKCLKFLDNIQDKFDNVIGKEIEKFEDFLKTNYLSMKEAIALDLEEETEDEQN